MVALISGAVVAGGAVYAAPASAEPTTPASASTESGTDTDTGTGTGTGTGVDSTESSSPSPSGSTSESPSASPSVSASSASPSPSVTEDEDEEPASPSPSVSSTPAKDTTAPDKADFKLNHTSVWLGQKITFAQTLSDVNDPTDDPATLTRVVNWGDGTTSKLAPSTKSVQKTYGRKGSFKVTVTVTDRAGNRFVTPAKTVAVTTATGTVSISRKTAYQGQLFTINVKKVPAGATRFRIDWSDGWASGHKATNGTSITGLILYRYKWDSAQGEYVQVGEGKLSGKRPIKIAWFNAKGYSVNQTVGTVNLLKDPWKPTLTMTKPSPANKASSWRTIRGTVADKGAGVRYVYGTILRTTASGKDYCLNGKKQWKRYYSPAGQRRLCLQNPVVMKVSKGKYSFKVPSGVTKNQGVLAYVWTWDGADNGRTKTRKAWLTRN